MTKKQIFRGIAFLLAACCVLALLCDLFERENNTRIDKRYSAFRGLEKDTVDAVWIGTSGVDRYWIGAKAYEEYGMTVYPLTSDGLPVWLFTNQIKEIYTHQNPELIIIDCRAFAQNNTDADLEVRARRVMDAMPAFSLTRLEAGFKAMDVIHEVHPEKPWFNLSLLLSYIKYHTKWEEEDYAIANNLGNRECEYNGFFMSPTLSIKARKQKKVLYDAVTCQDMDPISERALYDLLDYAEEKNIELLFVDTPQRKNVEQIGRGNTLYKILDERGIKYINFCQTDEEGRRILVPELSRKTDFYNSGHTNYYGAEKFTAVFAQHLHENYNFPDHRNEEAVKKDWDGVYDRIKATIKEFETNPPVPEELTLA